MKLLILSALFAFNANAAEVCSKYCNPEKSKPCGNSCISKFNTCRKSWTTACVGKREEAEKVGYENPKHVNEAPKK